MKGLKVYSTEGKVLVYGIEGNYYKVNRAIISRDGGKSLILRNTWTGEERKINLKEAKKLLKDFEYK